MVSKKQKIKIDKEKLYWKIIFTFLDAKLYIALFIVGLVCGLMLVPFRTQYITEKVYMEELRDFESIQELKIWLVRDNTDNQQYIEDEFDCEDFAKMLILNAEKDGYRLFFWVERGIEFFIIEGHMICGSYIKGNYYTIEPQTDEITCLGSLD